MGLIEELAYATISARALGAGACPKSNEVAKKVVRADSKRRWCSCPCPRDESVKSSHPFCCGVAKHRQRNLLRRQWLPIVCAERRLNRCSHITWIGIECARQQVLRGISWQWR